MVATVVIVLLYMYNISFRFPVTDSDFGPFPQHGPVSYISNYFSNYMTLNIPMQAVVGTGMSDILSPFYLMESIFSTALPNSAISQVVMWLVFFIIADLGMLIFLKLITEENIPSLIGAIIYIAAPMGIINFMSGGAPYALWWYAIVPWFLFISFRFLKYQKLKDLLFLVVILFFINFVNDQFIFYTVVLFLIPLFASFALSANKNIVPATVYILVTTSGLLFLTYIASMPVVSVTLAQVNSGSPMASYLDLKRSIAGPFQMMFANIPSFGFNLSDNYLHITSVSPLILYFSGIVDIISMYILFRFRKILLRETLLFIFFLYIYTILLTVILTSSLGFLLLKYVPYLSAIFPEYYEFPFVITYVIVASLLIKIFLQSLKERYKMVHWRKINFPKRAVIAGVVLVLLIGMLSPVVTSDITSGGYINEVNKLQPITYVPEYIMNASKELNTLKAENGMTGSRDLWEPMNYGTPFESGIIYADPSALFFPAENVNNYPASPLQQSYMYMANTLDYMLTGSQGVGSLLSEMGVGFIVILKNFTYNVPFSKVAGNSYNGSLLALVDTNTIVGNPLALENILSHQYQLKIMYNNSDYSIFMNEAYKGIIFGSDSSILPLQPISSSDLVSFDSSPIWQGTPPIILPFNATSSNQTTSPTVDMMITNGSEIYSRQGIQYTFSSGLGKYAVYNNSNSNNNFHYPLGAIANDPLKILPSSAVSGSISFRNGLLYFANNTSITLSSNYTNEIENYLGDTFSVNLWLNSTQLSYGNHEAIIGNSRGFSIGYGDGTLEVALYSSNSNGMGFYKDISQNASYMVTLVYNGSVFSFYLNGILVGSGNVSGIYWGGYPITIGYSPVHNNDFWNGTLSNILISKDPFNESQIEGLYKLGPVNGTAELNNVVMYYPLTNSSITTSSVNLSNINRNTILYYPLDSNYTDNQTLLIPLPNNSIQTIVGYTGNVTIDGSEYSGTQNTVALAIFNLSNLSARSISICGSKSGIFFVMSVYGQNLTVIKEELAIHKIEYSSSSQSRYVLDSQYRFIYISNTFVPQLSGGRDTKEMDAPDGESLVLIGNTTNQNLVLYYAGISPQVYQLIGLSANLSFALFLFFVMQFYLRRKSNNPRKVV